MLGIYGSYFFLRSARGKVSHLIFRMVAHKSLMFTALFQATVKIVWDQFKSCLFSFTLQSKCVREKRRFFSLLVV